MALVLLMSFLASSFEAVAGLVRDGSVHHETAIAALIHSVEGMGEHGHESASEAPSEEHGSDHQHGTGADHCTHTHGVALLTPSIGPGLEVDVWIPPVAYQATSSDFRAPPLFHPPRA